MSTSIRESGLIVAAAPMRKPAPIIRARLRPTAGTNVGAAPAVEVRAVAAVAKFFRKPIAGLDYPSGCLPDIARTRYVMLSRQSSRDRPGRARRPK